MNKHFEIIEKKEDRKMLEEISDFLQRFDTALTPIQIQNFVLNDIEFPTAYGKFIQTQLELSSRLGQFVNAYYEIKEKEIAIRRVERGLANEKDDLEKERLELEKEKLGVELLTQRNQVEKILKEARVFYAHYQKHPEFQSLTPEKEFELEAEQWAKKTLNMPSVMEERYGERYMKTALGEDNYRKYKELRQRGFGLLPREIFEVEQLPSQDQGKKRVK